jgi:4-aminobutyrate aminotransferase
MRDEGMLENAVQRGSELMTGLRRLQEEHPQIGDVRGQGLMIGMEFAADGSPQAAKPLVKRIVHAAEQSGLLLLSCGTYDNVIRWIPPLTVSSGEIREALGVFSAALQEQIG